MPPKRVSGAAEAAIPVPSSPVQDDASPRVEFDAEQLEKLASIVAAKLQAGTLNSAAAAAVRTRTWAQVAHQGQPPGTVSWSAAPPREPTTWCPWDTRSDTAVSRRATPRSRTTSQTMAGRRAVAVGELSSATSSRATPCRAATTRRTIRTSGSAPCVGSPATTTLGPPATQCTPRSITPSVRPTSERCAPFCPPSPNVGPLRGDARSHSQPLGRAALPQRPEQRAAAACDASARQVLLRAGSVHRVFQRRAARRARGSQPQQAGGCRVRAPVRQRALPERGPLRNGPVAHKHAPREEPPAPCLSSRQRPRQAAARPLGHQASTAAAEGPRGRQWRRRWRPPARG
eukprot:scaffold113801_cov57-Phaeocystis_antarctica.AAC.1